MAAMAAPTPATADGNTEELGSIEEEVAAMSRDQLIQFVVTGLAVGVNRTSAEVPVGWEAVVAEFLDATLQPKEAADLVEVFTHSDKARIESVVNKVRISHRRTAAPPHRRPAAPPPRRAAVDHARH